MGPDAAKDGCRKFLAVALYRQSAQNLETKPMQEFLLQGSQMIGESAQWEIAGRNFTDILSQRKIVARGCFKISDIWSRKMN